MGRRPSAALAVPGLPPLFHPPSQHRTVLLREPLPTSGPPARRRGRYAFVPSLLAAVCLGVAATSCASYNDKISGPLSAFERGDFATAQQGFSNPDTTGSAFLSGAEAGMAAFADGNFTDALGHFHQALAAYESIDDRGTLGINNLRESIATAVINDSQSAYDGEGYERVMLHAMLGMSYLAQGRAEDVLVEARRVDELLTTEEELYETEYGAGGIGHLLSALAYELMGKPGEAYIDYQRLADKGMGGGLVSGALLRLAESIGRHNDLEALVEEYGEEPEIPPDWPSVVVVAGLGMGPGKEETKITLPIKDGVFSMAVPKFSAGRAMTSALELRFPETETRVRTALVEDVSRVAKQNLDDRIALVAARSAARGLAKRQLADQMRDNKHGQALGLAADLFTIFSERADLRAWRTLPDQWTAARAFVAPNEPVAIQLAEVGGAVVQLGTFNLVEGETMFILARALDSGLVAHVVGGELVAPAVAYSEPVLDDPGMQSMVDVPKTFTSGTLEPERNKSIRKGTVGTLIGID